MTDRKTEISILNVAFCLAVIFIHITSEPVSALSKDSWQWLLVFVLQRQSFFVVAGFVFLAGMKLFLKDLRGVRPGRYYWGRFRGIIVPYIAAVVLYMLVFSGLGYLKFDLWQLLRYILNGKLAAHFYFVLLIAQFYALMPLWRWLVYRFDARILCTCALLLTFLWNVCLPDLRLPFSQQHWFVAYLCYWLAGCCAGRHYEAFVRLLTRFKRWIAALAACAFVLHPWVFYMVVTAGRFTRLAPAVTILYTAALLLLCYRAALWLSRRMDFGRYRVFRAADRAAYDIYLLHCLVIVLVDYCMNMHGLADIGVRFAVRSVLTCVFSIAAGAAVSGLRQRLRRF